MFSETWVQIIKSIGCRSFPRPLAPRIWKLAKIMPVLYSRPPLTDTTTSSERVGSGLLQLTKMSGALIARTTSLDKFKTLRPNAVHYRQPSNGLSPDPFQNSTYSVTSYCMKFSPPCDCVTTCICQEVVVASPMLNQ
jgi:hypothetical protein